MKKLNLSIYFLFVSVLSCVAQDTTKMIRHEIGFNSVSLIKQLISNNPSNTLNQLPYDVFYNLYFNPKTAMRVGLGLTTSNTKTEIEGQKDPRISKQTGLNLRLGLNSNFFSQNRLTFNVFADILYENLSLKSINTSTSQSFPNPINTTKVTSSDLTTGYGVQAGVGVKYNLYKHLSVYAEVPLSLLLETTTSKVTIEESGSPTENTTNKTSSNNTRITLPSTLT